MTSHDSHHADSGFYLADDDQGSDHGGGQPGCRFPIVVRALGEAEERLARLPRTDTVRGLRKRFFALQRIVVDDLTSCAPLSEAEGAKLVSDVVALATDVVVVGTRLSEEEMEDDAAA
jgi:hypothetical protein